MLSSCLQLSIRPLTSVIDKNPEAVKHSARRRLRQTAPIGVFPSRLGQHTPDLLIRVTLPFHGELYTMLDMLLLMLQEKIYHGLDNAHQLVGNDKPCGMGV